MREPDEPIRVLIVEDHRMLADLVRTVLSGHGDIEVTGWARNVSEARARVARDRPDVVLMDFQLPDGDGVSATRRILRDHPDVAVVMVTASVSDTVVAAALQAGCRGYITKDQPADEIVAAVRAVRNGGSVISPEMGHSLACRADQRLSGAGLSPRDSFRSSAGRPGPLHRGDRRTSVDQPPHRPQSHPSRPRPARRQLETRGRDRRPPRRTTAPVITFGRPPSARRRPVTPSPRGTRRSPRNPTASTPPRGSPPSPSTTNAVSRTVFPARDVPEACLRVPPRGLVSADGPS